MIDKHQGFSDDNTEAYQEHGYPFWIKLMFILLIAWGIGYSAYFLINGYDYKVDRGAASTKSGQMHE